MNQRIQRIAVGVGLVLGMAGATVAAEQRGGRPTDQQILTLLDRTIRDAQRFDRLIDLALGGSPARPVSPAGIDADTDQLVNELMDTTVHLRDHLTRRQVIESDVEDVLIRAARIDEFMRRRQFSVQVQNSWTTVRRDLDELARAFNVTWSWTSPRTTPAAGPGYYSQLSGTYQLDRARSDDARYVAVQAARSLGPVERQRVEQNLTARLDPPEYISIDRNGSTVSIASSKAPMGRVDVDGRSRTEPTPAGGVSTVRASFYGDQLMVTTTGNRGRDFTVTFEPLDAGATLRVTRSLDATGLTGAARAQSVYRRTADSPDWNVYRGPASNVPPRRDVELVPIGTVLIGQLDTALGSRTSRQGDRFMLNVNGPQPFQGAVLEGVVRRVGGADGLGRNELILDFDRIRLRDGRTAEFSGNLSQVRTPDGRNIQIDTEGVVQGRSSRSGDAVAGGAIGATIGAIIGAIADGGKGAAIGAAIGAGAGAGSVFVTGGRDLDLPRGTEVQVIAEPLWNRP